MAQKYVLSKQVFDNMVKHLVEIEDSRHKILEEYFPGPSQERNEFWALLEDYIKQVGNVIDNSTISESAEGCYPFVVIGSVVGITDTEYTESYKYQILAPFKSNPTFDSVSYLSPLGRALLLKKVGDIVQVNTPAGIAHYKIESIELTDSAE